MRLRPYPRSWHIGLLSATLVLAPTARLSSQQPSQQPVPTVSATMLRVLAEAADAYRTGKPVYLVADYRYPHNVLRGFTSQSAAAKAQADSGASYGIFGPYVTPEDSIDAAAPRVIAIRVITRAPQDSQSHTLVVNPRDADALFFSMSAVDKFVLPYYQKTLGPQYARTLRQKIREKLNSLAYIRHCYSWICVDPEGQLRVLQPSPGPQY
jgi:hypothetical protein